MVDATGSIRLTSMCIGLGMGGTVIWENPHHAEYAGHTTIENES